MTKTLYAELVSTAAREFAHRTDALNANTAMINRHGDMCGKFGLIPHVKNVAGDSVSLVARSERGQDHQAVLDALASAGYHIDTPIKYTYQFTDGWSIWTAQVHGHNLAFNLLFYIALDVC